MKPFLYLLTFALCLQPILAVAHGPHGVSHDFGQPQNIEGSYRTSPRAHGPNQETCKWQELDAKGRAQMWSSMTPRHRDYHWRLLGKEERKALRNQLTSAQKKELRQRFVSSHHHGKDHQAVVLYKRLSKEELQLLREQILQAQRQQILSGLPKTPATEEEQNRLMSSLSKLSDDNHQMLILTIKSVKPNQDPDSVTEKAETRKSNPNNDDSLVVPIDLAPKTPAAELSP